MPSKSRTSNTRLRHLRRVTDRTRLLRTNQQGSRLHNRTVVRKHVLIHHVRKVVARTAH